jgi:hypothetical protein
MSTPTSMRALVLLDSIGHVGEQHAGAVIVSGSHGGTSAADYILRLTQMPYAALFNDAGRGKDDAGLAGLPLLQARGVISATYSHLSARIGDANDGLAHGAITELNGLATEAGLKVGSSVDEAVAHLRRG